MACYADSDEYEKDNARPHAWRYRDWVIAWLYQSGFMPSSYGGVLFRNSGEPILNLQNPPGMPANLQSAAFETIAKLNRSRYQEIHDPEIAARISNYELAGRMQLAAPELVDLSDEPQLFVRSTNGGTRRTLYQHYPCFVGSTQRSGLQPIP